MHIFAYWYIYIYKYVYTHIYTSMLLSNSLSLNIYIYTYIYVINILYIKIPVSTHKVWTKHINNFTNIINTNSTTISINMSYCWFCWLCWFLLLVTLEMGIWAVKWVYDTLHGWLTFAHIYCKEQMIYTL